MRLMGKERLVDISHASAEKSSITIAIPKKVAEILGVEKGDIVAFKVIDNKVVLEIIK